MSPVRIVALLGLALLLAGLTVAATTSGHAHAWLTGQCFRDPAPLACHRRGLDFPRRQYDI